MDDRKTVISTMAPLPPTDNCKSIPVLVNESENIEDRLTSPREVAPSKPASHFSNHEGQFTKPPYAKQPDGNCDGGPYCNTFAPLPNVSIANHRVTLQTRGFDSLSSAQQNQQTQNERNDHFHRYVPESWTESMTFVPERCDSSTHGGRNNNRGRTTYSDDQIAELEKVFSRNAYPTPQARHQLAQDISVPEGKVKIWFQNRRARAKKQRIIANNGWRLGLQQQPNNFTSIPMRQGQHNSNNNAIINDEIGKNQTSLSSQVVPNWDCSQNTQYSSMQNQESACPTSLSLSCLSLRNQQAKSKGTAAPVDSNTATRITDDLAPTFPLCSDDGFKCYAGSWREMSKYQVERSYDYSETFPARFPVISSSHAFAEQNFSQFSSNMGLSPSVAQPWFHQSYPAPIPMSSPNVDDTGLSISAVISTGCEKDNNAPLVIPASTCQLPTQAKFPNQSYDTFYKGAIDLKYVSNRYNANALGGRYSPYVSPSTSSTLLRSPPPIRRFVFPFRNLLETTTDPAASGQEGVCKSEKPAVTNPIKSFYSAANPPNIVPDATTTNSAQPRNIYVEDKISHEQNVNGTLDPTRMLGSSFHFNPMQNTNNDHSAQKQQNFTWQMCDGRWQHLNSITSMQRQQQPDGLPNTMQFQDTATARQRWPQIQHGYGNINSQVGDWPRMLPKIVTHSLEVEARCPSNGSAESGSSVDALKRDPAQGVWSVSDLIPAGTQPPSSAPMVG